MKNLLIASIILFAQTVTGQNLESVAGNWAGSIEITGQNLITEFTFSYHDNDLDGTVDIPQQMAFNLPVEFTRIEGDSLVFQFQTGTGAAVFRGELDSERMTISGTFHQMNMTYPFSIRKNDGESADQRSGQGGEELLIETRAGEISGTLRLAEKPAPLIVLLTGSGAQDRDETVAGFKVFGEMANLLYQNGFSSFRYDDRGVGRSTGEQDATLNDLSDDLLDVLAHLENEYADQVTHTILLGHSQGGLVSVISAVRKEVDGIIFMGAPFLRGDEIINSQIRTISEAQGIADDIVEQNLEFQERIYDVIRNADNWDEIEQDLYDRLESQINELPEQQREALGDMNSFIRSQINRQLSAAKTDWFKSFIEYDPAQDVRELNIPLLVLFGEKDTQVIFGPNREKAEELRDEAELMMQIVEIESANHLFQRANSGLPSEYGMLEKEFAPGFAEAIIEWLNSI
ncbi:alpha/beta fold hydrolase [Rhodohalobacter halophilus]|uniref:alpha/beta fold hydrolase n=1 Tax=Rhodohalobacter halophilus TaxID=1812810 RepID=UPI00083F7D42|nr:alpha/beta hydrolase [Rhodohalobacter halophilus]